MNITKRLYAYPVLSEEKNDYNNSIFDVELNYGMSSVSHLNFKFDIKMNNDELQDLLVAGKAEFVIHMECPTTAFRTALRTIAEQETYSVPVGRLNGKLEVTALIVAVDEIKDFKNRDWNEDFNGITFDFSKGTILGYKNLPSLNIVKNFEELSNASSIFIVHKRLTTEPKPMDVNIDSSQIKIGLGTKEYELYTKFCKNSQFQPILNTMIVLPALVYVFEELKQENGIESNEGKAWFVSLSKAYEKRGIVFVDEILNEEKNSVQLAQEAMEIPLSEALMMLSELFENTEEEEDS